MKKFLFLILLIVLLGGGYFVLKFSHGMVPKDTSYDPGYVSGKTKMDAGVSDTPAISSVLPTSKGDMTILFSLKQQLSQIQWENEKSDSLSIGGKTYQGTSIAGTYQSSNAGVTDFGEKTFLLGDGWSVDNNLAAGGANGNAWGYTMDAEGGKQLLFFSYTNVSFTPPPGETKCPCTFEVKVFHADSL